MRFGPLRGHIINNRYNRGCYMTFFNISRIGFVFMQGDRQSDIDISISFYKLAWHCHFTLAKDNLCREMQSPKRK